ncbi:hypothetical protein GQ457_07G002620 [Hibiscus cannabinus]
MRPNESFRQYVQRWRDVAAHVQPPLLEKEITPTFVNRSTTGRVQKQVGFKIGRVQNRSGSKQVGFKTGRVQNRSGKIGSRVGYNCYSNRSDSVSGQHQSVTDQVRVIAASGQTRF